MSQLSATVVPPEAAEATDFARLIKLPGAHNKGAEAATEHMASLVGVLPPGTDKDRFASSLIVAINELNDVMEEDQECTDRSVLMAAFNCARLNLTPGKVLGLVAFIPRWNKNLFGKGKGGHECQLMVMYQGYQELAYRNGFLLRMHGEVVVESELPKFRIWNDEAGEHLAHEIDPNRDISEKQIVGAYCSFTRSNGTHGYVYVNRQQIMKAKDAGGFAWKDYFASMARKTPVKAAAKSWILTPDMALAVHLDEQIELGKVQTAGEFTPPEPAPDHLGDLPKPGDDEETPAPEEESESGAPSRIDLAIESLANNNDVSPEQAEGRICVYLNINASDLGKVTQFQLDQLEDAIEAGDIKI